MKNLAKAIAAAAKKNFGKNTVAAQKMVKAPIRQQTGLGAKSRKQGHSPATVKFTAAAKNVPSIKGNQMPSHRAKQKGNALNIALPSAGMTEKLKNVLPAKDMRYVPVTDYRVSSPYGVDRGTHYHSGIDLAVPVGTQVSAAMKGTVSFAGWGNGYGYRVVIDHEDGTQTTYNHLSDIGVSVGDEVEAGHPIALSGNSGYSTGPHLHFEVKTDGQYADPTLYFDFGDGATAPQSGEYQSKMGEVASNGGSTSTSAATSTSSSSRSTGASGGNSKKKFKTVPKVDFAEVSFTDYFRITDGGGRGGSSRKRTNYFDGTVRQASPEYRHRGWR